jgi:hypothetical protein
MKIIKINSSPCKCPKCGEQEKLIRFLYKKISVLQDELISLYRNAHDFEKQILKLVYKKM